MDECRPYIDKAFANYIPTAKLNRYHTFKYLIDLYKDKPVVKILELGTIRSFKTENPGSCVFDLRYWNPNNPAIWDWGSGLFSLMMAANLPNSIIETVDPVQDNLKICYEYTKPFSGRFKYTAAPSFNILNAAESGWDIIYMDHSTDIPPETQVLHLNDAGIIVKKKLLNPGGSLIIDDCDSGDSTRCKLSLPYLKLHNYKVVMDEYQVILQCE